MKAGIVGAWTRLIFLSLCVLCCEPELWLHPCWTQCYASLSAGLSQTIWMRRHCKAWSRSTSRFVWSVWTPSTWTGSANLVDQDMMGLSTNITLVGVYLELVVGLDLFSGARSHLVGWVSQSVGLREVLVSHWSLTGVPSWGIRCPSGELGTHKTKAFHFYLWPWGPNLHSPEI